MEKLWQEIGKKAPYWGVLTDKNYQTIDKEKKEKFLTTGTLHVEKVLSILRTYFHLDSPLENILDFGCGVGRLVLPFSKACEHITGIDFSHSMLEEAMQNCESAGVSNATFFQKLSDLPEGQFSLVHSYIVLQHNPPNTQRKLICDLLSRIKPGGFGMIHITFQNHFPFLKRVGLVARRNSLAFHILCNMLQQRTWNLPNIPMYTYDLADLFSELKQWGITQVHTEIETHGSFEGLLCYFQRPLSC